MYMATPLRARRCRASVRTVRDPQRPTANPLAKLAHGIANDALSCIALALNPRARILVAPAMNGKMWLHPATQQNVATLRSRGVEFIGPEEGLLSCGYEGLGRLWPVDRVAERAMELLRERQSAKRRG